ncbi:MAG: YeiH family protein [Planctomycetota bacterium]|nr:YeiH family protein [Planctomycetota bacterium]
MPSKPWHRYPALGGVLFVGLLATAAMGLARLPWLVSLRISPLVAGIVLGMIVANTLRSRIPAAWRPGILFMAKRILRVAIILYGFRLTMQQVADVGLAGLSVSVVMLSSTFLLGVLFGLKVLRMDRDTALLTASGASVCGAAAVLATDSVLKAEPHKGAVAVSTVVLFGTIAMFVYPPIYASGILGIDPATFGIYVGGSVHEVAQVVAAGSAIEGAVDNAVIVKMTRVMLIAPMLIILGLVLSGGRGTGEDESGGVRVVIPWFAVGFVGVVAFNSLHLLPDAVTRGLIQFDTFLLTLAMTALGLETTIDKFKQVGLKPFYLALAMFGWLLVAGYFVTRAALHLF